MFWLMSRVKLAFCWGVLFVTEEDTGVSMEIRV